MTAASGESWDPRQVLTTVGAQEDSEIDIAEAGLALAALDRQRGTPETYHEHLAAIDAEMRNAAAGADCSAEGDAGLYARATTLSKVLAGTFSYQGDRVTYDDLQNANLMHVIDRRKGLPVALAILYIHAARSQGWAIEGVNFPGHFVVRLHNAGRAVILDPFAGGEPCTTADLRRKLKAAAGEKAELQPEHYAAVGNRDILLRLENNLKIRLIQEGDLEKAAAVLERMLLIAPKHAPLYREAGLIQARLGNLSAARAALERFLEISDNDGQRHHVARLIQDLGQQIN
ncbi:SirB1 family protein [Dongia sedimenti]|uniref:Transglutaminase-like domain-containing protein n=1 Tax=Dongia sedimenti TaxID=3064282 RepID=A0ABU0YQU6_9PROT|nr:transglutaminase-like domain-containing protein [Rhodospirillaceae bacterium R-7]